MRAVKVRERLERASQHLETTTMLGAIAGDVIGSVYEGKVGWQSARTPHFKPLFHPLARFTDDTVLTIAVAESILHGGDLAELFKDYVRRYPSAGYGGNFLLWATSDSREPYNSWGNGAAMRVSPVGYAYDSLDEVLYHAEETAKVTHDHPEGIKGAQATAAAVYLARAGKRKEQIRHEIERRFGYELRTSIDELRPRFSFEVSCRATVPPAIIAFLESTDYEHAVRLAVSLGGDSDTIACITGGIAHAFHGSLPTTIREQTLARLDDRLRSVVNKFEERFARTARS
jgi:ADP-ribosylglycohydrolase